MGAQPWFRGSGLYLLGFFISLLSAIKRSSSKVKKKTTSISFDPSTQTLDTRPRLTTARRAVTKSQLRRERSLTRK